MTACIEINRRQIGTGYPVYIVAEMSANHGQNFERAVDIIKSAKEAGADAIKLQTFTPDTHTLKSDRDCFRVGGGTLWDGRTLYDLYAEALQGAEGLLLCQVEGPDRRARQVQCAGRRNVRVGEIY